MHCFEPTLWKKILGNNLSEIKKIIINLLKDAKKDMY